MARHITTRIEKLYMRAFVDFSHKTGSSYLSLALDRFASLRNRNDYIQALGYLEALGLITVQYADGFTVQRVQVINTGDQALVHQLFQDGGAEPFYIHRIPRGEVDQPLQALCGTIGIGTAKCRLVLLALHRFAAGRTPRRKFKDR